MKKRPWQIALTEEVAELEEQAAADPKRFFSGDGNDRVRSILAALVPIKTTLNKILRI